MKYISAGHCNTPGSNYDPGAPGVNGRWEANETVILRDAVVNELRQRGYNNIICDLDAENRHQYLNRIKTGGGSVVVEFHFNAGPLTATGTEALISVDAGQLEKEMAGEFAMSTSRILGIRNRGVKPESVTRHKRLGLMRKTGLVVMVEVCFISNANDMAAYDKNFNSLIQCYTDIIIRYDDIVK